MPAMLTLSICASALTAVTDWAGWHFVWRHQFEEGEAIDRKRNVTSIFMSYFLPFMPTLAILLGPAKLNYYNEGFATAASMVMFVLMGVVTGGVAASAYTVHRRHHEEKDSRELIDQKDLLPPGAMQHLMWTTILLGLCSLFWFGLLLM